MRYIALLRGINISGKNKISMPELKTALGEKGFGDVKTYLNSGNVISQNELKDLLSKAPSWWGSDSKDIYDNLIFAIAPHSIETVAEKIGDPSAKLEKVEICGNPAFFYSTTAIASISTSAPFGKAATSKQLRAGFETKYFS